MLEKNIIKPIVYGSLASGILPGVYFFHSLVGFGMGFCQNQFSLFWYFIASLASRFWHSNRLALSFF